MPAIRSEVEQAEREGIKIHFQKAPVQVLSKNGRLTGLQCVQTELGEPDADGRRQPILVDGSQFDIELDNVIIAIGQIVPGTKLTSGLKHTDWGTLSVDPVTLQTNVAGVFAGGDAVAGPADAISAIADGKEAAISIKRYLGGMEVGEGRAPRARVASTDGLEVKEREVMPAYALGKPGDFSEAEPGFDPKTAVSEARRCWSCGTGSDGVDRNTYCVLCLECVKTCPNDNVALNIRRPFHDIFKKGVGFLRTRDIKFSLSLIAIVLLGVIPFHNLEMTNTYTSLEANLASGLGISEMVVRTTAFLLTGLIAVAIFFGFSWLAQRASGDRQFGTKGIFTWFALTFIPLAISLHLAHNYFHLLEEGAVIIPNLSDPFGFGWDLFGTAGASVTILPATVISNLQFITIGLGFLASGYALYRLPTNMFAARAQALRSMAPMTVLLIGMAIFYLWVLTIPMSMRF
jgi:ferredoxin